MSLGYSVLPTTQFLFQEFTIFFTDALQRQLISNIFVNFQILFHTKFINKFFLVHINLFRIDANGKRRETQTWHGKLTTTT